MRIEETLAHYTRQLRADGRSRHTIAQCERHITMLSRWVGRTGRSLEIADLGHVDVAEFLVSDGAMLRPDGKPKKPTSVNALRSSLKSFFRYLHRAEFVPADPTRLVRRALCSTGPPKALSVEEEQKLLAALDAGDGRAAERDRVLFRLMLGTGIRVGSAVAIVVEDVDLERSELRLRCMKGCREDVVYIPAAVVSLVREFVSGQEPGLLFLGQAGSPLTTRHVRRRLRLWADKAGITRPVSPHALRHTLGQRLYERTHDVMLVKAALCHRSIASTLVYARVDEGRLREALGA